MHYICSCLWLISVMQVALILPVYATRSPTNRIFLQVELPHTIVTIGCLGLHCDSDVSILLGLFFLGGPVWVGGFLVILHEVAQHHNSLALKLPDHPPEVIHSSLEWSLSGYVSIPTFVALERENLCFVSLPHWKLEVKHMKV